MNDQVMNSFVVSEQDPTDLRISALDMAQRACIAYPAPTVDVILERAEKYLHFLQTGKAPAPSGIKIGPNIARILDRGEFICESCGLRKNGEIDVQPEF